MIDLNRKEQSEFYINQKNIQISNNFKPGKGSFKTKLSKRILDGQ